MADDGEGAPAIRLVFEADGYPVELLNAAERERAVRDGRLLAETPITLFRDGGSPVMMPAGAVPELAALFAPRAVPTSPPSSPIPAAPAAPARPLPPARAPSPPVPPPSVIAFEPVPPEWRAAEPAAAPPPVRGEKRSTAWLAAGGIALALLVGMRLASNGTAPGQTPATTGTVAAPAPTPTVTPVAEASPAAFFAARALDLFREPTAGAPVGSLPRGTALTGTVEPAGDGEERWVKIMAGADAGLFVPLANLSATHPPPLDFSDAGERTLTAAAVLHISPQVDAPPPASGSVRLSPGETVTVVGALDATWLEVASPRGGVAYLARLAIDQPVQSANASEGDPIAAPTQATDPEQRAQATVATYFREGAAAPDEALAYLPQAYADTMRYYGKATPRGQVIEAKRAYVNRWPLRSFDVQLGSVATSCDAGGTCTVTGLVDWTCESPERGARSSGVSSFSLTISGPTGRIEAEGGRVLSRG